MIGWSQQAARAGVLVVLLATGASSEPLEEILEQIDRNAQKVTDLTCSFVEEKHTSLLKNPMVSKGKLFAKGERTRWHTTEPHESMLFTDPISVAIYFPSRKTMEVYPVDRRLADLIVSPLPRIETLRRYFHIEVVSEGNPRNDADAIHLRLRPREKTFSTFFDEATVSINRQTGLAFRFERHDPQGDRTVIRFTNVRTNIGLSDADVACTVPSATKIVRPLGLELKRPPTGSKQP